MKKLLLVVVAFVVSLGFFAVGTIQEEVAKAKSSTIKVKDGKGQTLTFKKPVKTVATLSAGELNSLNSLGVKIVGRPETKSTVPSNVKNVKTIGSSHMPNIEQIVATKPDVLVVSIGFEKHAAAVERAGIKVYYATTNKVSDVNKHIENYGKMFAKEKQAKTLISKLKNSISKYNKVTNKKAMIVYGVPGSFYAALDNSLWGDVLKTAGGVNAASDFEELKEFPQYANLSVEGIIKAKPEIMFIIAHGDPAAVKKGILSMIEKNPAWDKVPAIKNDKFVVLPPELFSTNPGARIHEAVAYVHKQLKELK
ncbi:MAG: ABC transporter substrate-binding protein [Bacilli bacterium]